MPTNADLVFKNNTPRFVGNMSPNKNRIKQFCSRTQSLKSLDSPDSRMQNNLGVIK